MVAQDPVLLGAEALDAAAALVIEEVRPELDRDAIEFLEGVRQQQQFALRIDRAALHTPGVPGRADLDAAVGRVDVHVGGHARDLAVGIEHGKRQHRPGLLQTEPAIDLLAHIFGLRNEGVPELPQLAILHRFGEPVAMLLRQRLKPRMRTAKGNRFKPGHSSISVLRHSGLVR